MREKPDSQAKVDEFYACRSCDKLYWEGPKSESAYGHFSGVLDGFVDGADSLSAPSYARGATMRSADK